MPTRWHGKPTSAALKFMADAEQQKVQAWLDRVAEDLASANKLISEFEPEFASAISFHAQQFAEKALKAYLVYKGRQIEKTHDLTRLITMCSEFDASFRDLEDLADLITPLAAITRYPDDWRQLSESETRDILEKAKRILNFVKSKFDPKLID